MESSGIEWNRVESSGIEWNRMESEQTTLQRETWGRIVPSSYSLLVPLSLPRGRDSKQTPFRLAEIHTWSWDCRAAWIAVFTLSWACCKEDVSSWTTDRASFTSSRSSSTIASLPDKAALAAFAAWIAFSANWAFTYYVHGVQLNKRYESQHARVWST